MMEGRSDREGTGRERTEWAGWENTLCAYDILSQDTYPKLNSRADTDPLQVLLVVLMFTQCVY